MCLQCPPDWALYRLHTPQTAEVLAEEGQTDNRTGKNVDAFASKQDLTATYRETLSQHASLLQLPWSTKFFHISAEVAVSTLRPNAGLTALTPAARRHGKHIVSSECAKLNNSTFNGFHQVTLLIKALTANPDV